MIKVDGYKAFRGTMRVIPKSEQLKPFLLFGDWLYKPEHKCWYCSSGNSYGADICTVAMEDDDDI